MYDCRLPSLDNGLAANDNIAERFKTKKKTELHRSTNPTPPNFPTDAFQIYLLLWFSPWQWRCLPKRAVDRSWRTRFSSSLGQKCWGNYHCVVPHLLSRLDLGINLHAALLLMSPTVKMDWHDGAYVWLQKVFQPDVDSFLFSVVFVKSTKGATWGWRDILKVTLALWDANTSNPLAGIVTPEIPAPTPGEVAMGYIKSSWSWTCSNAQNCVDSTSPDYLGWG